MLTRQCCSLPDEFRGQRPLPGGAVSAPHPSLQPTFVGRHHALSALRAALARSLARQGELVLLVGDAGMGKTRTAEELAALAAAAGFRVLWGRCHEEEGAPPYWPWIQALRAYADADVPEGNPDREADALAIDELSRGLGGWLATPESAPGIRPEAARFRLFDAVNTFWQRAARRQPLLLLFDDLHAADRSSLRLLAFVARARRHANPHRRHVPAQRSCQRPVPLHRAQPHRAADDPVGRS